MDNLESLTKTQLREKCKEYGLPNVPITDTTQKVIIQKLRSAIKDARKVKHSARAQYNAESPKPNVRRTIAAFSTPHSPSKEHRSLRRRTVLLNEGNTSSGSENLNENTMPEYRNIPVTHIRTPYYMDDSAALNTYTEDLYDEPFPQRHQSNAHRHSELSQYNPSVMAPRYATNAAQTSQVNFTPYASQYTSALQSTLPKPAVGITSASTSYSSSALLNRSRYTQDFQPTSYSAMMGDAYKPTINNQREVPIGWSQKRNEILSNKTNSLYPTLSNFNEEENDDNSDESSEEAVTYPNGITKTFSSKSNGTVQRRTLVAPQSRPSLRQQNVPNNCVKQAFLHFVRELQHHYHIKELLVIIISFVLTLLVCVAIWG